MIRYYILETDIHPFVAGITFEQVFKNEIEGTIDLTPVYFAALDELIKMKKAVSKPKDKEDLKILKKVEK